MPFEFVFPDNVEPLAGERVFARYPANRRQGANNAVGGLLWLTSHRVLFTSHALDSRLGGKNWSTSRDNVVSADVVGLNLLEILGGGLRRRLKLELRVGKPEIFVVGQFSGPGNVDHIVLEFRSWILR
ncbi:hypothetical protein [Saccharomonospora piscinae]|uniref:hypothetical protein n=1 Tax=Saccharomonospora piscinae TaxID=687388 RepID=UPI00111BDC35|nr:hypothetical protein [Saccharomonospora piscinae]